MYWLVQGCQPGDSLLFHYSGHGSRQRNYNGDEVDGYDETLCPLDFETQGMIVDDEINATIVKPLIRGVKLHAIIDACHSGTVLDLPFLCRMNRLSLSPHYICDFSLLIVRSVLKPYYGLHLDYLLQFLVELGSISGKITVLGQVCGREPAAERPFRSAVVTMIKHLLILQ